MIEDYFNLMIRKGFSMNNRSSLLPLLFFFNSNNKQPIALYLPRNWRTPCMWLCLVLDRFDQFILQSQVPIWGSATYKKLIISLIMKPKGFKTDSIALRDLVRSVNTNELRQLFIVNRKLRDGAILDLTTLIRCIHV